jgi:hypothetical protein
MNVGHMEIFTLRAANLEKLVLQLQRNKGNPCGDFLEIQFKK